MDKVGGNEAHDAELVDSFSLILPLPYRVAIIIVLGVWAWGMNLQYLSAIRIVRLFPLNPLSSASSGLTCTIRTSQL